MTIVQEIKARNIERMWADVEGLMNALSPAMEKNAKRRREVEIRKAREARRKRIRDRRKARVNAALHNAGVPLRVV